LHEIIIKETIVKLSKSNLPSICQSLLLPIADLFIRNASEAVKFFQEISLANLQPMQVIMHKWLNYHKFFRGDYLKNVM
jgi:hypothetical protein